LDSDGKIAEITLETKTRRIKDITFNIKNLRFRCKRCATFCCKLGGPKLSVRDVERLEKAGYNKEEFLESGRWGLKGKADGSCVFLQFNQERGFHECSIYDVRPILCRLYPFYLQKMSPDLFMLRIMPCRGISRRVGKLIDERFIINHLSYATSSE